MTDLSSKKPLRVGIVGCGLAAQFFHAPAYRLLGDIAKVVAIADPDTTNREMVRNILPTLVEAYASYEEMAECEPLDVLDIMLPHHLYAAAVKYLAPYRTAIMLEKPFARSLQEAQKILSVAQTNFLSVMHNYRYGRRYQAALEAIRSGSIGKPALVRLESLNTGMETIDPSLQIPWRNDSVLAGGGTFHDHGYHLVYLARMLMGSEVASVSATMGSYGGHGDTLDTAVVTLRHKSGGMSILMDGRLRGDTVAVEEVFGTKWMLTIPYDPLPLQHFKTLLASVPRATALQQSPYARSTAAGLRDFFEAFRAGAPAPTTLADALQNLRIVLAAERSNERKTDIYIH